MYIHSFGGGRGPDSHDRGSEEEHEDDDDEFRGRAKRQKTLDSDVEPADDPAQEEPTARRADANAPTDDGLHDSDDDDDGWKGKVAAANPLDTTAVTADLTLNLDQTFDTAAASQQRTQETASQQWTQETASPPPTRETEAAAPSFRQLHRRRRARIRLHYSAGSYHASPFQGP